MSESPSAIGPKTRICAAASTALFIVGLLLLPLIFAAFMLFVIAIIPIFWAGIAAHAVPVAIVLGFTSVLLAIVCELAALGLGVAGQKHFAGKVGMIGGTIVLVLPLLIWLFQSRH
jgi:hypothetical protein